MRNIVFLITVPLLATACKTMPVATSTSTSSSTTTTTTLPIVTTTTVPPTPRNPNVIEMNKKFFKIGYDKKFRVARYTIYTLTAQDVKNAQSLKKKDQYFADSQLVALNLPQVKPKSFPNGYDQGHLVPAEDMAFSKEAFESSFVMTNMVPREIGMNRGPWRNLEKKVRLWACGEEKITVITGPGLPDTLGIPKIGATIPNEFYKIIIDETPPIKVIAFVFDQMDRKVSLKKQVVPLAVALKKAGENFPEYLPTNRVGLDWPIEEWREKKCGKHGG